MSTPNHRILIVEDEQIVAMDVQQSLEAMGYAPVAIAASADEAIRHATAARPDLVLMDIRIKGERDGIETAELLRRRFDTPVVYMTAHADEATVARAAKTEPHGYLLKPVKAAELRSAIEVALYKHDMERRLRQRERWFSTLLRSIADPVIAVGPDGKVALMNPAAERLTGIAAADGIGRDPREVLRVAGAGASEELPLQRALRERCTVRVMEMTVQGQDARPRTLSDAAAPVIDADDVLGAVMTLQDITEMRGIQRRLELSDRMSALGTLAAGVGHEVNNPLTVITMNADLIAEDLDRLRTQLPGDAIVERTIAAHDELRQAATRIARILEDLRVFSRQPLGQLHPVDVNRTIEWALRMTQHALSERVQRIVRLGLVPPVAGDEVRLGQVLVNLLINAAQALAIGGDQDPEIAVSSAVDERGCVVIEVRDTGAGIPPDLLGRIFEPFFTTKGVGEGTGLGLAISREIVDALGGDLEVESEVGRGARFRVVLPALAVREGAAEPASAVAAAVTPVSARILIVDDEPLVLRTLAMVLSSCHEVVAVDSARAALDRIAAGERFDAILTDVAMPEVSGVGLYRRLQEIRPDLAARTAFITGGALSAEDDLFLRSLDNPCLFKPVDHELLRRCMRELTCREQNGARVRVP